MIECSSARLRPTCAASCNPLQTLAQALNIDPWHALKESDDAEQAVFPSELDAGTGTFDAAQSMKRVGGPIAMPDETVTLRVLVDHSCVEVFVDSGEALATR